MKKLILLVTLLVTLGASAGQITHEQLVKITSCVMYISVDTTPNN
jgi:hypothetical protein